MPIDRLTVFWVAMAASVVLFAIGLSVKVSVWSRGYGRDAQGRPVQGRKAWAALQTGVRGIFGRRFTSVAGRGLTAARWSFGRAGDRILAGLAVGYVMVSAILPMAAILLVSLLPFWKPNFSITDFTIRH